MTRAIFLTVNLSDSRTAVQQSGASTFPLARLSAAEAVFNAIRSDIQSGGLAVGAKLSSEAALATQYGVSRSVIREALRSCTALGLTVTKKVGNSVVRNRIRRLLREWMRLHGWVPPGWDMVLVAKDSAARQLHPDDFATDLTRVLRQLS